MKNRILVVDDEVAFREVLKASLDKHGYVVSEAENGKVARDLIAAGEFDLVISDIKMSHFTGLELLEWIMKTKPIPVILMTGFANLLQTQEAHALGVKAFLTKPFQQSELLSLVKDTLHVDEPVAPPPREEHEYCKVPIEDFVIGRQMPFNIFIHLAGKKYVKIAHMGEDIELERIREYKNRGLEYLYLKKDDYAKLVGFSLSVAKKLAGTSEVNAEKKQRFIRYAGEVVLEQVFVTDIDQRSFKGAKDFVETSLKIIAEDEPAMNLLDTLNSHSDYIYAHSMGVSVYAVMIAQALKWESSATLFKVSLAGLFHDIGKKEIDRNILLKPRPLLTAEERALIETHPVRGRDILRALGNVSDDVIMAAYHHHENGLGNGFPNKLTAIQLAPITKIVCVANIFCEYAIRNPSHPGMTGAAAVDQLLRYHGDELDKVTLNALKSCVAKKSPAAV